MTDININDIHYKRYLKYKSKYLELKQSGGGALFSSSPHTVETLKNIKKDIKKDISYGDGSQWYDKINFNFKHLIDNLKTDLTNIKSTFDQKLLDTFVESPDYTKIIYGIDTDLKQKVNLKTNFNTFDSIPKHFIPKNSIDSISLFIKEINTQLNNPLNLTNMEYKQEFKEILTTYLGQFVTQYYEEEASQQLIKSINK